MFTNVQLDFGKGDLNDNTKKVNKTNTLPLDICDHKFGA